MAVTQETKRCSRGGLYRELHQPPDSHVRSYVCTRYRFTDCSDGRGCELEKGNLTYTRGSGEFVSVTQSQSSGEADAE